MASEDHAVPNYLSAVGPPVSQFRLGVPPCFYDNLDEDVTYAVEEVLTPSLNVGASAGSMAATEAYAYHEPYITSERGSYKPQTLPIFERGAQTKTSDYIRMWRELQSVRRTVDEGFQNVDLLITPTRRRIPRAVDAEIKRASSEKPLFPDPENTRPFNAFGLPTISIPCGFSKDGDPDRSANQWAAFGDVNVLALLMLMNTPPNGITRAAVDSRNQVAGACNNGRVQPGIFMNRIVDPSSLQTRLGQVPVRQFA